jgi:hypothetical protein
MTAVAADSTQLSTVGPSHRPNDGTSWERVRAHPTHETEVDVEELPKMGLAVTTLSDGVSSLVSIKSTWVS